MTTTRPVQEFFSIGEVCALTDLKPHVLRYWESQFRFLNPAKNRSGNRVYKSREMELIMLVKHLLYTEKYTIEGARQRIDQYRRTGELQVERAARRFEVEMAVEARGVIDEVLSIRDWHDAPSHADRMGGRVGIGPGYLPAHEHPGHERRRHPRSRAGAARRRVPGGRRASPWWRPTGSRAARPTR